MENEKLGIVVNNFAKLHLPSTSFFVLSNRYRDEMFIQFVVGVYL